MRTLALGDVHGNFKALKQCLERSKFDYQKDKLICLGDIADGWPDTKKCFDEILKIKNLIFIMGNHDKWFLDFIRTRKAPKTWVLQGGKATLASYGYKTYYIDPEDYIPIQHKELLENARYFYVDKNRLFVHAGLPFDQKAEDVPERVLIWDRDLINRARLLDLGHTEYEEVFIGHTSTYRMYGAKPFHRANIWGLDQGGGYEGVLTLMDIDTKEYWQSDKVDTLYDTHNGRTL